MKKIILSILASVFFTAGVQAGELIDLNKCSSYYDGCNTCSVENWKIWACTEMACFQKGTPKCLKPIEETKKIASAQEFCETYKGFYDALKKTCTMNGQTISASSLFSVYRDISENMMYLGWSKYFDERTGSNNFELMQSDYDTFLYIKKNIPVVYKQYSKEISEKMKMLQEKLNIKTEVSPNSRYEMILGKKNMQRIDIIANKLVSRTNGMSHIQKERFLIEKVQLLDKLRTKYVNKNFTGKYRQTIVLLEYLNQQIEKHIAYE